MLILASHLAALSQSHSFSMHKSRPRTRAGHTFPAKVNYVTWLVEGSLEVKLPTIWIDEKQRREEAERRERF